MANSVAPRKVTESITKTGAEPCLSDPATRMKKSCPVTISPVTRSTTACVSGTSIRCLNCATACAPSLIYRRFNTGVYAWPRAELTSMLTYIASDEPMTYRPTTSMSPCTAFSTRRSTNPNRIWEISLSASGMP